MMRSRTPSHRARRKYGAATIALIAAGAVVVIGGVAGAVTLTGESHGKAILTSAPASHAWTAPVVAPAAPSFTAVANVTPPVAATNCASPSRFSYSGTLSATTAGTVKYQWVYSSGQPGPVRTVNFTAAGNRVVTGGSVTAKTAGGGWGEIKVLSPVARTSDKAAYKLLCGGSSAGGITVTAAVTPATRIVSCATGAPSFTAAGSIEASKAETVTYYWAQSSGKDSAPATLTFTGPGTKAAAPLTITPPPASGGGEAVLVVTSPVTAASAPAGYTLTCKAAAATPTQNPASPGSNPASTAANPASSSNPASNPTSPESNPSTAPASTPATPPTTSQSSPPQSQNPGSLSFAPNLSETVNLGDNISIGTGASGGTTPYTWTESGLPSFVTATSGGAWNIAFSIVGTATAVGTYPFTVTLSDSAGDSLTKQYTLTVLAPNSEEWSTTGFDPSEAEVGIPFSGKFYVAGQTSGLTISWTLTAGSFPPGLSLDSGTGVVTGTPTQQGTYGFTVVATNVATGATKRSGGLITVYPAGHGL